MNTVLLLAPFVAFGVAVLFMGFSGGARRRRRGASGSPRTSGGAAFKAGIPAVLIGLGIIVPIAVTSGRQSATGGTGQLVTEKPDDLTAEGKILFGQNCASCHSLAAYNARGATGPSLDELGKVSRERVVNAIRNGGTGDLRMPAGLLEGEEAEAVATYVSRTAGQ